MNFDEYRNEIINELMKRKKTNGTAYMTEAEARKLLSNLSDEELEEGLLFNTTSDIADLLIEVGKLE